MTKPAVKTTILFAAMSLACLALRGGEIERKTTPVMGWSSWNSFGLGVNYDNVKAQMDALVRLGLRDLGWTYVNIDDCFQDGSLDCETLSKEAAFVTDCGADGIIWPAASDAMK